MPSLACRWLPTLGAGVLLAASTQCARSPQLDRLRIVTTDIDHFWAAYPLTLRDTSQAARVFVDHYFARASPGLREYYARKYHGDARLFARRITQRPRYYASVRATTLALQEQKPLILAAFRRLQALYPPVRFQPIYFVVGGFAGSTAQTPGLLIGADQTANGPGVDTSELSLVQRNRCGPITNMPNLVTHELIHNNQQPADGTLLSAALREGMADFIAELVNGSLGNNARLHAYGQAHERELWRAFEAEMGGHDTKNWLANPGQETPEKPCDLGYYVGYRICQAYYRRAADKKQAVADLLRTTDFAGLLQRSGYAAQWAKP